MSTNTSILIKRSTTTGVPGSLKAGELAYSYASNTMFIGTIGGTGVVNVGGQYYTSTIDAATDANTAGTLVRRDQNGAFNGHLIGTTDFAGALSNTENFSISGGDITASAVGFNGTQNVTLNASLNAIPGLSAGYYGGVYGGTSSIPIVQVAANGRIMSISNTTVASSFNITDGVNSNTVVSGTTLTFNSGGGVTATVSPSTEAVTFGTDNTVARTNTSSIGAQVFSTDINLPTNNMHIGGTISVQNIQISGEITYANAVSTLNIGDPIIYLAANNNGNLVDIGMVGHFNGQGSANGTSHYQHTGFVRDYSDNKWKLFSNVHVEPTTTVTFDANSVYDVIKVGGVDAAGGALIADSLTLGGTLIAANLSLTGLANTTGDLGVGGSAYITNNLSVTGTTRLVGQANTTNDLGVGGNSYLGGNLNVNGNVTLTNALTVPNGGTGAASFSAGGLLIGNGTGALSQLANTTFTTTGTAASNTNVSSVTVDAYGRFTNVTYSAISGLTVGQGGTGLSTITQNGITYGNGTGNLGVTAAAGAADQTWSNQILTVTNSGVPVWTTAMDGGSF